eukprot:ANDGO_04817.mRNA.1 Glutathione S-transferase
MSSYTLLYFPGIQGRARQIRLLLAVANQEWTEEPITIRQLVNDTFADRIAYRQIPVLKVDGVWVSQCGAIMQLLGKRHGLLPSAVGGADGDIVGAQALGCVLAAEDFRVSLYKAQFHARDPATKQKETDALVSTHIPRWYKSFAKIIAGNGNRFVCGSSLCYADLAVYDVIQATDAFVGGKNALDAFPELKEYVRRIEAIPQVARFLASAAVSKL